MARGRALQLAAAAAAVLGAGATAVAGLVPADDGVSSQPSTGTAASDPAGAAPGPPAPRLAGTDPVTGEKVRLADFRGKPVVVNVWASWCRGCEQEAAALKGFADEHPEAVVLGLDLQDTAAAARRFYERWGWSHPSILDPDGRQSARLGVDGMPSTFFLDEDHRIVTSIVGAASFERLEDGLEQAKRAS